MDRQTQRRIIMQQANEVVVIANELLRTRLSIKMSDVVDVLIARKVRFNAYRVRMALVKAGFPTIGRNSQTKYLARPEASDAVESASSVSNDLKESDMK